MAMEWMVHRSSAKAQGISIHSYHHMCLDRSQDGWEWRRRHGSAGTGQRQHLLIVGHGDKAAGVGPASRSMLDTIAYPQSERLVGP